MFTDIRQKQPLISCLALADPSVNNVYAVNFVYTHLAQQLEALPQFCRSLPFSSGGAAATELEVEQA